jgi:hypothetical protein
MSNKQYHFVVQFDTETNEFSLDIDTLYANFRNGIIFDKDQQEWVVDPEVDSDLEGGYLDAENVLSAWLTRANEVQEEESN